MSIQFLPFQGFGGTAVPYERREAPQNTFALSPSDSRRVKRYEEHWRFYQGIQWGYSREDGDPLVTANYCKTIVNKKASWLVGKGITIDVPEALNEKTKPILEEVWTYNNSPRLLLEMAISGGVTGDVFVLVTRKEPTTQQKAVNPHTQGKTRIQLLGSHQVFPLWNPLDKDELLSVRIITEVNDARPMLEAQQSTGFLRPVPIGMPGTLGVTKKRKFIQTITDSYIQEGWEGEEMSTRPNDLGEIPIVHIPNEPFPGEFYGQSDLDGIIDLQRELNEKLTDVSDIVHYHAAPVTVITGAKAKQLERGPKSMWSGLPADAEVKNLELGGNLAASHEYLKLVQQILMDIANLPEGSLGRIQAISNTAAAALQVQFQPLVEATERKTPTYTSGIEKINYFILRYEQIANNQRLPVDMCRHCGGRIVELEENGVTKRRCFLVDPHTFEFMAPDDVEITFKRKFSYGVETRKMPYWRVKEEALKEASSYWDPLPEKDLEKAAADEQTRNRKLREHQAGEAASQQDVQKQEQGRQETDQHAQAAHEATTQGMPKPPPPSPQSPTKPTGLIPAELEKEPEVKPEQLAPHDMDIPEEPERVHIQTRTWNAGSGMFDLVDQGIKQLVPSGCKRSEYLNPYETRVRFKSALPRDIEKDTNLYATWQQNGWVSRRWVQIHLEEDINVQVIDKEIADDIPFILALQGKPDPTAQVAQTAGVQDGAGSNNGAPLPPGPGPGRGNLLAPGDNLATSGKTPPNAAPGEGV